MDILKYTSGSLLAAKNRMPSGRRKSRTQEFWTEEEVMDFGLAGDEERFGGGHSEGRMTLSVDHSLFSSPYDGTGHGTSAASEITKSGRMRKKTAKLIEMEEVDKLEKIPRKADIGKSKKPKTPRASDRLPPKTSSAVDPSNLSEDSGDLAPLVIANVFSLSSAESSNPELKRSTGVNEMATISKSTKSAKAKKQKVASASSETFGELFGSMGGARELELEQQTRTLLGSGVDSNQTVVSTPQFGDVGMPATKKHSKKNANVVPPPFTIKLENPLSEPSLVPGGVNANEMSLSLSSSFPEILPQLQSPAAVKEEVEHAGSSKDEGVVMGRKDKPKKKHKSGIDPTDSTDDCLLLNLMSETQLKKKKRLVIGPPLQNPRKDTEKPKKKRQKGYTAYMLWCSVQRAKVVAQNPGIDFAQISKRLGDMWQTVPEKEKMTWRRKARRMTKKGSSLIKTGFSAKEEMSAPEVGHRKMLYNTKPLKIKKISEDPVMKQVTSIDHIDVAAHFKLLGESLTTIGARLQEHGGQFTVQGSLSVLLDSLLCTLGPLMCVTNQVPQINGTPEEIHRSTLENIAYIMPGVG